MVFAISGSRSHTERVILVTNAEMADRLEQLAQELQLLKDVKNQFTKDHKKMIYERLEQVLQDLALSWS